MLELRLFPRVSHRLALERQPRIGMVWEEDLRPVLSFNPRRPWYPEKVSLRSPAGTCRDGAKTKDSGPAGQVWGAVISPGVMSAVWYV